MFEGQPKGLWALSFANTGERFGYYTMLAVFILFLQANFGWSSATAGVVYSSFLMLVYFLPLFGGMVADRWGYSKMVTIGIYIMFAGYALLSVPLGTTTVAIVAMAAALVLVSFGTGMFKGNLQVMVGDLYNDPKYANKRDAGFSLFYMLINVGALFAPTAAIKIMKWAHVSLGVSEGDSYHFAFAVACASLIVSIAIFYLGRPTFRQVLEVSKRKGDSVAEKEEAVAEISPAETKERIICLCLVFAVVIFFWMAFHQNGATLTYFARDYVALSATGLTAMEFDVTNLMMVIFVVYGLFGIFQSHATKPRIVYSVLAVIGACVLVYKYLCSEGSVEIDAPIFQQFNPCFVVALTPVSIAIFGALAKRGKEPKAPVKIGLGMLVAAVAYLVMTLSSIGLPAPDPVNPEHLANVSPNILVSTYLILTFAELLLSPIGISFVSKVAPPKYKGMMMGGWFVATAVGNFLVSIPTLIWGHDLYIVWGVLMCICLVAALFIFSIIRKLNKVA